MVDPKFCVRCGANLSPGNCYCPECGNSIEGTRAYEEQADNIRQMRKSAITSFLTFALAIYAIPAIIGGILMMLDAGNTAHILFGNTDFLNWRSSHGFTFTEADLKAYVTAIGGMELVSGALAGASLVLINKGIKRKIAVICCVIAAILCVWSVFGTVLGLIMAWNIYDASEVFVDE